MLDMFTRAKWLPFKVKSGDPLFPLQPRAGEYVPGLIGPLSIAVDHTTTFQLLREVLNTAGNAGYSKIYFVVREKDNKIGSIMVKINDEDRTTENERCFLSPEQEKRFPEGKIDTEKLAKQTKELQATLEIALSYVGFIIIGPDGVQKASDGTLPSIKCSMPLRDGHCPAYLSQSNQAGKNAWKIGYDFLSLNRLGKKLKSKHYPTKHCVILTADQQIPFQVLIKTIDTLSTQRGADLFDVVGMTWIR
jgi:biopolymer transport protein ExbD